MLTCTWAPTVFEGMQLAFSGARSGARAADAPAALSRAAPRGAALRGFLADYVQRLEGWGVSHLLVAQRWWGSGQEMEGSSHDCLAMTALIAGLSDRIELVTAIHPGFMQPTAVAKWGATIDAISDGRWSINVTSGWNMAEFEMYGIDPLPHDERYARASEFIEVLRGAWATPGFDHAGRYYQARGLRLEPRPGRPLTVFQGGQSPAAVAMAARHADWMFLNGGDPASVAATIARVREACAATGRQVRFALYANPLVRESDAAAWAEIDRRVAMLDPERVAQRRALLARGKAGSGLAEGARAGGMWTSEDALAMLDTNEGFASRLIGAPDTVLRRIEAFHALGVDMLHLTLADAAFIEHVLPHVHGIGESRTQTPAPTQTGAKTGGEQP